MNGEVTKLLRTFSDLFKRPLGPLKEFYLKLPHDKKEQFKEEIARAIKEATAYQGDKK